MHDPQKNAHDVHYQCTCLCFGFPLRNLLASIFNFVPCDRVVQRAYCCFVTVFECSSKSLCYLTICRFCPGVPVYKRITIVLFLFRSHRLAVVYCLILCSGSCKPVHEDRRCLSVMSEHVASQSKWQSADLDLLKLAKKRKSVWSVLFRGNVCI